MPKKAAAAPGAFAGNYPALAEWVEGWGWIKIARDDFSTSFIRVPDIGGMIIWEGAPVYPSVDAALQAAENATAAFLKKNG
jgi:hypothetical protein